MSAECQGKTRGKGQLYRRYFLLLFQKCQYTTVCAFFFFFLHLLGKMIAGVHSTEDSEHTFVTYPVLLLVAHAPLASLQGSACSLLLLSCHSDLPLGSLVLWG